MAAQCVEPDSIVDSTAQRVDASVLVVRRIGLLVGLARHGRDSTECRSIPTAQKNARSSFLLRLRPAIAIGSTEARLSTTWRSAPEPHMRRITPSRRPRRQRRVFARSSGPRRRPTAQQESRSGPAPPPPLSWRGRTGSRRRRACRRQKGGQLSRLRAEAPFRGCDFSTHRE